MLLIILLFFFSKNATTRIKINFNFSKHTVCSKFSLQDWPHTQRTWDPRILQRQMVVPAGSWDLWRQWLRTCETGPRYPEQISHKTPIKKKKKISGHFRTRFASRKIFDRSNFFRWVRSSYRQFRSKRFNEKNSA